MSIVGRADWNISDFNRSIQQWKHIMKRPRNDFVFLETNIETDTIRSFQCSFQANWNRFGVVSLYVFIVGWNDWNMKYFNRRAPLWWHNPRQTSARFWAQWCTFNTATIYFEPQRSSAQYFIISWAASCVLFISSAHRARPLKFVPRRDLATPNKKTGNKKTKKRATTKPRE